MLNPLFEQHQKIIAQNHSIFKQLGEIRSNIIEIKRFVENNDAVTNPNLIIDSDGETDKYIPCQDVKTFEEFDEKLKSDKNFNKKIVRISLIFF